MHSKVQNTSKTILYSGKPHIACHPQKPYLHKETVHFVKCLPKLSAPLFPLHSDIVIIWLIFAL